MKLVRSVFGVALLSFALPLPAAVVYQSGVIATSQTPVNAFVSDGNNNLTGTWAAVRFTINTDLQVDSIMAEGIYVGGSIPVTDFFTIAFFQDGVTVPSTLIGTVRTGSNLNRSTTGVTVFSLYQVYHYTMDLSSSIQLAAGTYWLSVANDTPSNAGSQSWAWTASADGTSAGAESPVSQSTGYQFSSDARTQVFSFDGAAIPEPKTTVLLIFALVAFGFFLRRQTRIEAIRL